MSVGSYSVYACHASTVLKFTTLIQFSFLVWRVTISVLHCIFVDFEFLQKSGYLFLEAYIIVTQV